MSGKKGLILSQVNKALFYVRSLYGVKMRAGYPHDLGQYCDTLALIC